jgi:ketosteroid isomerase-like protein
VSLEDVFEQRDLEAFLEALAPDVVWQGVDPSAVCRSREEAQQVIEGYLAQGGTGRPEIVAEAGDRVVVDPHPEPPPEFAPELHQVFTLREEKIVRIDDYRDRQTALEAVGLR